MGVKGLLKLVHQHLQRTHVSKWANKRVAIDGYAWLHRGVHTCAKALLLYQQQQEPRGKYPSGHLNYCLRMLKMLVVQHQLRIVLVFDGAILPAKRATSIERQSQRRKAWDMVSRTLGAAHPGSSSQSASGPAASTDASLNQSAYASAVEITPQDAYELRHLIQADDELKDHVECITAPYEADAQIAYLCRTKYADLAISEDSDLIIYGTPKILFKMDGKGEGMLLDVEALIKEKVYDDGHRIIDWSHGLLLGLAALAGCDYLRSLPGVGHLRALAHLAAFGGGVDGALKPLIENSKATDAQLENVVKSVGLSLMTTAGSGLSSTKKGSNAEPVSSFSRFTCYRAAVYRCRLVYLYQRVYDPITRTCQPGRPLPDAPAQLAQLAILAQFDARLLRTTTEGESDALINELDRVLLGKQLTAEEAQGVANGKLHPSTLEAFPPPRVVPKKRRMPTSVDATESSDSESDELSTRAYFEPRRSWLCRPQPVRASDLILTDPTDVQDEKNNASDDESKDLNSQQGLADGCRTRPSQLDTKTPYPAYQRSSITSPTIGLGLKRRLEKFASPNFPQPAIENSWLSASTRMENQRTTDSRALVRKRLRQANPLGYEPPIPTAVPSTSSVAYTTPTQDVPRVVSGYLTEDDTDDDETTLDEWVEVSGTSKRNQYLGQLSRLIDDLKSTRDSTLHPSADPQRHVMDEVYDCKPITRLEITSPPPQASRKPRIPQSAPHQGGIRYARATAVAQDSDLTHMPGTALGSRRIPATVAKIHATSVPSTSGTTSTTWPTRDVPFKPTTLFVSPTQGHTISLELDLDVSAWRSKAPGVSELKAIDSDLWSCHPRRKFKPSTREVLETHFTNAVGTFDLKDDSGDLPRFRIARHAEATPSTTFKLQPHEL